MEPFHFASSGNQLIGIYHPASDPSARVGVVLCPPFGNELARTYRAGMQLAQRWEDKAHILRFDYSATGDSFGDWDRAGPACWISDIVQAADELSEISGAERIVLAGIRFGALLAANAALRTNASKLIFWDPVLSGQEYRNELDALHQKLMDTHSNLSSSEKLQANTGLCGCDYASWMDEELRAMAMPAELPSDTETVCIVDTIGHDTSGRLPKAWTNDGMAIDIRSVDFSCDWDGELEAVLNPSPVLEELARCL